MEAGIGSFAYTWGVGVEGAVPPAPLGPLDLVDAAAGLGVPVLQLADNVPVAALDAGGLAGLRAHAAREGVRLELGARGLTAASLDRHLTVARALDARLLRYVVDAPGHEPSAGAVVALLRDRLGALDEHGVTVALENPDRVTVAQLAAIVRAVDSPRVGICLDTVNSIGSGEGLGAVLTALAPLTVSLHVKDFAIRRRRHGMGFVVTGARLGDGMLDLAGVLAAVGRHGRCATAVLEQWAPERPTVAETVALERDWARAGSDVLRRALAARPHPTHEGAHRTP